MNEMVSVMATDEEIKEFDKKQLEKLLNDLKDIDKFTGFKDGAFKYELGKYQANILIAYIEDLQQENKQLEKELNKKDIINRTINSGLKELSERIDKAIEYIKRVCESENNVNPYILHAPTLLEILKGDNND